MTDGESNFRAAVRAMQLAELSCPCCGESNKTTAKPMLELDQHGQAFCNKCSTSWEPKEDTRC